MSTPSLFLAMGAVIGAAAAAWAARKMRADNAKLAAEIEHRRLAASRALRLEKALDESDDAVFIFDVDERILYANLGAVRVLGRPLPELLALHFCELYDGGAVDVVQLQDDLKARTLPMARFECTLIRGDGGTLPVETQLQYQHDGARGYFLATARDLRRAKEVDRLKDEFVSIVSHELRTPLTSIRGALGIVAAGGAGELSEDARTLLAIADQNADRLVRIIGDILDMQKIAAGQMDFDFAPLELGDLCWNAVAANHGFAAEHGVRLTFLPGPEPAFVRGDRDRLTQVLANLLSNAAKYSPPGGRVEVSLARTGERWRVAVRDHGPGIPKAFQPRVFSKFAQAGESLTRAKGGTGLGLSIAKLIVERHGGSIDFETQEGAGTTFFFELRALGDEAGAAERNYVLAMR